MRSQDERRRDSPAVARIRREFQSVRERGRRESCESQNIWVCFTMIGQSVMESRVDLLDCLIGHCCSGYHVAVSLLMSPAKEAYLIYLLSALIWPPETMSDLKNGSLDLSLSLTD